MTGQVLLVWCTCAMLRVGGWIDVGFLGAGMKMVGWVDRLRILGVVQKCGDGDGK